MIPLQSTGNRFLTVSSFFSLLVCLLLLILKIYVSISFIPDISGSEGSTIIPIQRLLANLPIYTNPQEIPFLISQYTPIYFTITSSIARLLNVGPDEVHKVFIISRFLSILLTTIGAIVIGLFLHTQAKVGKRTSILAACFIYQILSFWFLTSSRPDSLMFLLSASFVTVAYNACTNKKPENMWWLVAVFIAITAFFTKQNGVAHCLSIGIFMFVQRRWLYIIKLAGAGLLFATIYFFILPIPSFNLFFLNVVGGVSNSISWGWFYDWTLEKLLFQFAPLIALNIIIIPKVISERRNHFLQFLSICSIIFFLFSTTVAFKIGSGVGYYQGYLVMSVTLTVIFFSQKAIRSKTENSFGAPFLSIYLSIVAVHCLLFVYMRYTCIPLAGFKSQYLEQAKVAEYLTQDLKLEDNQFVYITESENFKGNYLKHFLFRNNIAPFSDIVLLGDKNSTFDYQNLDRLVQDNKIKYVITPANMEPTTILGHDFPNATKIKSVHSYDIYQNY